MAELVITTPDGAATRCHIGSQATIGRHPACEVVVGDPMASRRHCRVFQGASAGYLVEDLGSANGTLLNGEILQARRPMRFHDTLQIGSTRLTLEPEPQDLPAPSAAVPAPVSTNLSVVRLKEDRVGEQVAVEYSTNAQAMLISEAEASSPDQAVLQRVTERLRVLMDLGQSLGTSLRPRKLLQDCLDKLFQVFPQTERGFILLSSATGELPSTLSPTQETGDELDEKTRPLGVGKVRTPGDTAEVQVSRTVVSRVRSARQSLLISDTAGEASGLDAGSMLRLEIRSVMCAPLIVGNQDLGILYLDTKDSRRRFGPDDVNLLNAVAGQIAIVLRNAELAREAAAEATVRQGLQRFLSPHLTERILKKELNLELGGSLKRGTVFFSDLVGFTRMAGQMRPQEVVGLLNRYFRVMQEIIFARGGTVDKLGGDEIMAFWGVLVDTPLASAAAAAAALEMQNAIFTFNREVSAVPELKPPEPLGQGIGLNTGEFIAGNIGSERKIEFTVIGNSVNIAQRLQCLAGRGQVFIGQGTYEEIKERAIVFRLPDCPLKNVTAPLPVYSLRGLLAPTAADAAAQGAPPGVVGHSSRLDSTPSEMLYSLPCMVEAEGAPATLCVVTRMAINREERRGRFQLLTERSLPLGARVRLRWNLAEKPSLWGVQGEVEHTWTPGAPGAGKPGGPPVTATQMISNTLIIKATDLSEDVMAFRPGLVVSSDLTSPEQIVRR